MTRRARLTTILIVVAAMLPAAVSGEVVRLRDGSTIRGRLVHVDGDSLMFRMSIGTSIVILRQQVLSIAFDDSVSSAVLSTPAPGTAAKPASAGEGTVRVAFKDRNLSSKISIKNKKDWEAHERSNHIVVEFLVDGKALYTVVDTTMDKRIYKGQIQQLKNDIELQDFSVNAPAGPHQCELVVHNLDEDTYRADFDPEPLHVALVVDDFNIPSGGSVRIDVGIDRGTIRLGRPKFYRIK